MPVWRVRRPGARQTTSWVLLQGAEILGSDPHTWAVRVGRIHLFLLFSPAPRCSPLPIPNRGFQLWMPGWTWLQGGGGNSLSLPPSPSPHPSSFLLPLPALCLPPSFSSEAVESPRSTELRAPCSRSRLELNCASGGSWSPGPGAASPGLSPGCSGRPPRPWFGTEPRRGAGEPGGRAGAASGRVREQDRGRQGDGRKQRAEGRVQRAAWLGGGRRPAGTELYARDCGRRWGADPGWPRVPSDSPAHGGGRACSQRSRPSPARRSAALPLGHVSGKSGLPAARTRSEEEPEQERGARSPAPG